jgi:hypothetical protein
VNGIDVVLEHEVAVEGQVALVTLKVSNVQMDLHNVTLKV